MVKVGGNNFYPENGIGSAEDSANRKSEQEDLRWSTSSNLAKSEEGFSNPLLNLGLPRGAFSTKPDAIASTRQPELKSAENTSVRLAVAGKGGSVTVTLSGDPRVLIALLMAKDAEESLDPLNETAKKLQSASDKREAIRALKEQFNRDAASTNGWGAGALSVSELDGVIERGRQLGIDVTPFEKLKGMAESEAGAASPDNPQDRIIGVEFPDNATLHQERQALVDKGRTAFDDASQASRDSQTSVNFEIQLQMQNHTNLYTTASQTLAELKRQNGAVSIS